MFARIALLVITVFWLTMNFLLWRSEFGRGDHEGSRVPVEVVWKKILSAPDSSNLEIRHHGKKSAIARYPRKSARNWPRAILIRRNRPRRR